MALAPSSPLHELAELFGVHRSYVGTDHEVHVADDDTLTAVLRALGTEVGGPHDVADAVRVERIERATRALEPVLVHRTGRLKPLRVVLPSEIDPRHAWLTVHLEDGTVHRERLLSEVARPTGSVVVDGRRVDGYQLRLGASASFALPPGLHQLRVDAPGLEGEAMLISAPRCPQPRRGWGVFLPLYALRTDDDWGVGHYGDLGDLRHWAAEAGGSVVGTLPLYPTFLYGPVEPSPYRPVSRLMWSELYVDPTALPELEVAPAARDLLGSEPVRDALAAARRSVLVDHAGVAAVLRRVLEPMADALFACSSARRDELEAFLAARPEVEAYARFRAAGERLGVHWEEWGHPGEVPEGAVDDGAVRFHLYAQWAAHQQLAAAAHDAPPVHGAEAAGGPEGAGELRGAHARDEGGAATPSGLYLDLPVGVHPWGFDPWWEPEAYVRSLSVGAPPDDFFAGGQHWGLPPLHPESGRRQGYRHLVSVLRQVMSMASTLRIDHVMGLHRLYCIPEGADAVHGAYVRYPDEELRALVIVEALRSGTTVVGEDLGTVPDEVRTAMARDGMQRSWVLQFESTVADPLPQPLEHAVASWGTHDLARFAAYWHGEDLDDLAGRGELDRRGVEAAQRRRAAWRAAVLAALAAAPAERADELRTALAAAPAERADELRTALAGVLGHLAGSPARLVLVDLEDLWFERRPQNRPGTGAEAANWRRRAARTMEQVRDDHEVRAMLSLIDRRRSEAQPVGSTGDLRSGPRPAKRQA